MSLLSRAVRTLVIRDDPSGGEEVVVRAHVIANDPD
jgi:hypothetical protein